MRRKSAEKYEDVYRSSSDAPTGGAWKGLKGIICSGLTTAWIFREQSARKPAVLGIPYQRGARTYPDVSFIGSFYPPG